MKPRDEWFPAKGEKGVVGRFEYYNGVPDVVKSRAADEFVPLPKIACRQKITGNADEICVPVKPFNKDALINRFPEAWRAFNGEEVEVDGMPLETLGIPEGKVLLFRLNAVSTVEQLADLTDAQCEAIGFGTRKLRAEAQARMAALKADADKAVVAAAAALAKAADDDEAPKRKPGRPSKAEQVARAEATH